MKGRQSSKRTNYALNAHNGAAGRLHAAATATGLSRPPPPSAAIPSAKLAPLPFAGVWYSS